jgi:hypothetical protein
MLQARAMPRRVSHDASACSRSERASGSGSAAGGSISRRSVSMAANCPAVISSWTSRPRDETSVSDAVWSASTARVAADAGLLISWARPAASVPRVTRDSRWRAVDSIERAVW